MRVCRHCLRPNVATNAGPATCDECRRRSVHDGSVERMRALRAQRRAAAAGPIGPDALAVQCWCQAEVVLVPRREVRAGRTRTCGARGCDPGVMVPAEILIVRGA